MKKAIVIGAGIGGLSAGLALEQTGFAVTLYERGPQLAAVGQGGLHTPSGKTLAKNDVRAMEARFGAPTVIIHRADLTQILQEKLIRAIKLGKRFTGYSEQDGRVHVSFEDGTHDEADILVCADGIHSVLRQTWFPTSQPIYAGYTAWRGVAAFDHQRVGGHWGETLGRGTRFGLAAIERRARVLVRHPESARQSNHPSRRTPNISAHLVQ